MTSADGLVCASPAPPRRNRGASPPRSPLRWLIIRTGIGARRAWIGSLRPRAIRVVVVVGAIHLRGPLRAHGLSFLEHDDLRSDWGAVVKIDDVMIEQPNAAARHLLADRLRFDRAVKAEVGVPVAAIEVKRARPE